MISAIILQILKAISLSVDIFPVICSSICLFPDITVVTRHQKYSSGLVPVYRTSLGGLPTGRSHESEVDGQAVENARRGHEVDPGRGWMIIDIYLFNLHLSIFGSPIAGHFAKKKKKTAPILIYFGKSGGKPGLFTIQKNMFVSDLFDS